jgi:hypothetical protein
MKVNTPFRKYRISNPATKIVADARFIVARIANPLRKYRISNPAYDVSCETQTYSLLITHYAGP